MARRAAPTYVRPDIVARLCAEQACPPAAGVNPTVDVPTMDACRGLALPRLAIAPGHHGLAPNLAIGVTAPGVVPERPCIASR